MTHLSHLTLTNFRNHRSTSLQTNGENIIVLGENGAGKTNILEAISLFAQGNGLRSAKPAELDCQLPPDPKNPFAHHPWSVTATLISGEESTNLATGRDPSKDKRIVKIDGEPMRGKSAFAQELTIISLTPRDDSIFIDGGTSRRAYLDRLTALFFPEHSKHLGIYDHAKSERRKLLYRPNYDPIWCSTLEARMAEQAVAIASSRLEALRHINHAITAQSAATNDLFPQAKLSVTGDAEDSLASLSALDAESELQQIWQESRQADRSAGRTTRGSHRSDFCILHPLRNLRAETCSTGEQKALLLSITMAAVRARKSWDNRAPILLLDDIMSHLDAAKRTQLCHEITALKIQSWITGTDPAHFSKLTQNSKTFTVKNGAIPTESSPVILSAAGDPEPHHQPPQ